VTRNRVLFLLAASGAAAGGFALLARAVAHRETDSHDERVRRTACAYQDETTRSVAEAVGPVGKEWLHGPVAAALSLYAWSAGVRARAALPVAASITAELCNRGLERGLRVGTPPPGRRDRSKPSFPSGHAMEATAVALTSAYVLARAGLAPAGAGVAVAGAVAALSGASRLYLERHWSTDVLGGWLAGVSIAGAHAALHDVLPS
jgi:membrane-associated phospholipid phosphatase